MKKLVLLMMVATATTGVFAQPHHYKKTVHHKVYKHHVQKHKAKKETCWRTNTHTGAKFRIC